MYKRRTTTTTKKNKNEKKITTTTRLYLPDLVWASNWSAISTKHAARERSRRISSVRSSSISEAACIADWLFKTSLPLPLSLPEGLTSTSDDVIAVPNNTKICQLSTMPCSTTYQWATPPVEPVASAATASPPRRLLDSDPRPLHRPLSNPRPRRPLSSTSS